MSLSSNASEAPVAAPASTEVKTIPEHIIIDSIVDKKEFSEAELVLVNTRLQSLEGKIKEKLKNKEAKLTLTPEKIAELRAELTREWAWTTKELTKERVDAIIDEKYFENSDTTEQTPKNMVESVQTAATALQNGQPEEALKAIEWSGVIPNNFMKKILEFFYTIFGDSRISFDQSTMFDREVAPAIESLGITLDGLQNKNDIKVMVMNKLWALGVPVEYSDRYFRFINSSLSENDIPQKLLPLFIEGRNHYQNIKDSLSTDPKIKLESILDFTPPKTEVPEDNKPDNNAETSPTIAEKVKIWDKEIKGTPEEVSAYTTLEKTAKNILWKTFDAKSSLTAVKQGTESELTTISRDIFYKIVSKLRATYGDNFANSLTGKDITDNDKKLLSLDYLELNKKTPKTMAETLEKNLWNIFWSGVKVLEKEINAWSWEDPTKKEISQKLLLSIKWYQSEGEDKWAKDFQPEIVKWYDRLIAQNIGQTSEWKKIQWDVLKKDATTEALKAYNSANPRLGIPETV